MGDMSPATAASFATENAPKCTISRVKILPMAIEVVSLTGFNHKYNPKSN